MLRRHRRSVFESLLSGLSLAKASAEMSLCLEADRLEAAHGEAAILVVREQVQAAPRKLRKRLYRLHDELVRRRRGPRDEFGGLTA
jgi:hypothetical protein